MFSELAKERAALASTAMLAFLRSFKGWRRSELERWTTAEDVPSRVENFDWDVPTALFATAARKYKCVVEIGAMDGHRIIAIKERLPDIQAFGLDIGKGFEE